MSSGGKKDSSISELGILVVGFIVVGFLVLYTAHPALMRLWKGWVLHLAYLEYQGVLHTALGAWVMAHWFHASQQDFVRIYGEVQGVNPVEVPYKSALSVGNYLTRYANIIWLPLMGVLLVATIWDSGSHRNKRFRNAVELRAYVQSRLGGYIGRLRHAEREPIDQGESRVALTPWQFAIAERLVSPEDTYETLNPERWGSQESSQKFQEAYEKFRARATGVFGAQLGEPFARWPALRRRAYGWLVDVLLEGVPADAHADLLTRAAFGHQYDLTVLVSLLTQARRFGVIMDAKFRAVRYADRHLWYALVSAGRRTGKLACSCFVEGAGIIAQYETEAWVMDFTGLKNTLNGVDVSPAVAGLHEALIKEMRQETGYGLDAMEAYAAAAPKIDIPSPGEITARLRAENLLKTGQS